MTKKHLNRFMLLGIAMFAAFVGQYLPVHADSDAVAPDEPYRYVQPPSPSKRTALPPTIGQGTDVIGSSNNDLYAATQEIGAQASLNIVVSSLHAAPNAKTITLTLTPKAPDGSRPTDGTIAGNVYTLTGSSDTGSIHYRDDEKFADAIYMRLPQGYPPGAIIEYRASAHSPWVDSPTTRLSYELYQGSALGLGDYAIVANKTAEQKMAGQAATAKPANKSIGLIIAGALILIACGVIVLRIKAARKR